MCEMITEQQLQERNNKQMKNGKRTRHFSKPDKVAK